MKDNEFVVKHYKAEWPFKQALFRLFKWNNETINVCTRVSFSLLEIKIFSSCGLNFVVYLIVCADFDIFVMNYSLDS